MTLLYQSGFGNEFASEAIPNTLPQGQNSPQRVAHGLYAELLSGTAFTAPRHENRRTWLYRRQPSVVAGDYVAVEHSLLKTAGFDKAKQATPPNPLRWQPLPTTENKQDFIQSLITIALNGDADAQSGMAAHRYSANVSMTGAFINADGELLIVPQTGTLHIRTELGLMEVAVGEIAVIPRGMAFRVSVDGLAEGYICENYGAAFRLPELGPIGSNGLANARDFLTPVAAFDLAFEADAAPCNFIKKYGGQLWQTQGASPFNVVAWHGNYVPYKYNTAHFMTIGSISFDHPDPSIFTVLTSPSDTAGTANCDFVIFPPRWLVAEHTFRPPWFHRNVMSEFMGLVHGQYDAKPGGFKPGGMSIHNSFVPHGPDAEAFNKASAGDLAPHKLDNTLAFMFESRLRFQVTDFALNHPSLDTQYSACWAGLQDHFKGQVLPDIKR